MENKPNVLFIMTDQQNAGISGLYGNKIARTPNIDRLGAEGITFDACYTNSPLCVPCRLSITSGKYISRTGAWNNHSWLPSDEFPSIARQLQSNGYETLLCGKMHYDYCRRYGFEDVLLYEKGGSNTHTKTGISDRIEFYREDLHTWNEPGGSLKKGFKISEKSSKRTLDTIRAEETKKFFKNRKKTDKPFFYLLGYVMPHPAFSVSQDLFDHYKDNIPSMTASKEIIDNLPENYQKKRHQSSIGIPSETNAPIHKESELKKARAIYYGMVEWIDNKIGEVLHALKESEVADNTIVIFTTDHGESLGEHGMWGKSTMYDESARVPLIISWPEKWIGGQRRTKVCSLVDVVQTILEITSTESPLDWDGDSLVSYLDDPDYKWKDYALSEIYNQPYSGITMFREGKWKYIYHNRINGEIGSRQELFDMANDPAELTNLAADENHQTRIADMHAKLMNELGEDPEKIEKKCRHQKPYFKDRSWWFVRQKSRYHKQRRWSFFHGISRFFKIRRKVKNILNLKKNNEDF